ncbi:MAG: hypothetical protein M1608_06490 [Candidatus Omnitrophica bacterium]|nr:hypothetical protein [Candidatus Omnitrophota bacterium]
MKKSPILPVVLLVVLAAIIVARYAQRTHSVRLDLKPEQALGEVTAEETDKLLNHRGQILLITEEAADPLLEAQIEAFQTALKKTATLNLAAVERLKPLDPLLRTMNPGGPPYLPEELLEAVKKHPQADAVVSFVGLPIGKTAELEAWKQKGGKVVAIFNTSATRPINGAMERHLVDLAIVAREEAPAPDASPPRSARALFDRYYLVLRPR